MRVCVCVCVCVCVVSVYFCVKTENRHAYGDMGQHTQTYITHILHTYILSCIDAHVQTDNHYISHTNPCSLSCMYLQFNTDAYMCIHCGACNITSGSFLCDCVIVFGVCECVLG